MKKLNIVRIIDAWGWAYDFVGREQNKYSRHNIVNQKWDELDIRGANVVYMCGPNMNHKVNALELPKVCKSRGVKFIGGYSGPSRLPYSGADALVAISPQNFEFMKTIPYQTPKILMTEGSDQDFFVPRKTASSHFKVGWSGRLHDVKRPHLLKVLKRHVTIKSDWGKDFFKKNRSLDAMRDWYHSIDCLVLTSESECCPRVVLEAMACGLPVVSTDVGFVKMFIGSDWVVPVNPEETVVKEINRRLSALRNPKIRRSVGQANRNMIDRFLGWRHLQPLWDDMYEAVYDNNTQVLQKINNIFVKSINT